MTKPAETVLARESLIEKYMPRVVDTRLKKLLKAFGGVEITGPRWCGKTWTATIHANSVDTLMDPATLQAAQVDASLVLEGKAPHLIDEWQEVPAVWDATRNRIDAQANQKGQFILTGSSLPKDNDRIRHSGTGRIARLRMYPMTLHESGATEGGVSFASLFDGEFSSVRCHTKLSDVARWCCRGGWPSIVDLDDEFALETPAEYIKSILEVSVPKLNKNPSTALSLMRALSVNISQAVTFETLARDMQQEGQDKQHARITISSYLQMFKDLFLFEDLSGWEPPLRSKKRVRIAPKRYFVDPSLPSSILGANPNALLRDMQTLGGLFETLCLRDIRVYLSALSGATNAVHYYRDENGLEVDFIIELSDGRWGAVEAKLSDEKVDDDSAGKLAAFKRKITKNPKAQVREPSFLAFIVGKGGFAYRREDGILVIPLACLEA